MLIKYSLRGRVTFNTPNAHYEVDYISEMIKIAEVVETTKINNLYFEYSGISIKFNEFNTYLSYERDTNVRILARKINGFLKRKTNKLPFNKSEIFLLIKPIEKRFWLQDKTPLWLSVLLALIPIIISVIALLK